MIDSSKKHQNQLIIQQIQKVAKLTHFRGTFGLAWVDDTSPASPGGFFSSSSSDISSKVGISMSPPTAIPK